MVTHSDEIKLTKRKSLDWRSLVESIQACLRVLLCCRGWPQFTTLHTHLFSDQITEDDHHIQLIACLKGLDLYKTIILFS